MDPTKNDEFPKELGNYILLKSLGRGGMGEVFLAQDTLCQRKVALKKIRYELQKFPSIRHRFLREARIAAQLSHPSIVPIFNISDDPNHSFYTMPYIEGLTLKEVLKAAPNNPNQGSIAHLSRIFLSICQAVAYAHSKNILHRDLKPENVLVGKFGEVMIVDWGLAQVRGEQDDLEGMRSESTNSSLTRPGKVVGTLAYLAPERARGSPATEESDLYSLGVILFQILTFKQPFKRQNLDIFQKRWQFEQIPDPIEIAPDRDIPHALNQMVLKALKPNPQERYSSVQQLVTELESFLEGKPDWIKAQDLIVDRRSDWEFEELILLAKHRAISRSSEMEWVSLMLSKPSFSGNVRLEATVRLNSNSHGVGFIMGAPEPNERKDLMDGFCLWIGAKEFPGCQLFRNNIDLMKIPTVALEHNCFYLIKLEKNEHHLKLFIDGQLRLHYLSQTPLMGSKIGLIRRDTSLEISPIHIWVGSQNVVVSCLAVPDALLNYKEFNRALIEYRKIATSFPGRTEGREALYRAGLTLVEASIAAADSEEKLALLEEALHEFEKLHSTAGAPLEYLGKSMVYQVLKEWGEEVKCLELAVRRYSKHPLSHRIIDHIIFRLHEASSHERLAAYHLALLALMHLRYLFTSHDHKQIIDQIQKQWTHLPFFSVDLPEGQLAFLLSKKFILLELIDTQKEPEDAFFALLELGHKEDIQSHSSLDLYPSVKSGLEPLSLNLKTVSYHPLLCHYLFYFYFERGLLEPLLELPLNPILQFTLLIALRQLDEAHELLKTFSLTEQTREDSPLFVLIGCYLWALEGEDIAKAHFNGVEVMLYPPCTTLLAYEIMGKLDSNRWLQEALFWEKLSLYRQQLLLAYCLNQKEEVLKLQTIIQKLRDHS